MEKTYYPVNIDTLESFKNNINGTLTAILKEMTDKNIKEAEISSKISISLNSCSKLDEYGNAVKGITPVFTFKVGATYKGKMTCPDGGFTPAGAELVYDEDNDSFILVPVQDAQGSIFDDVEDEKPAEATQAAEPAGPLQLRTDMCNDCNNKAEDPSDPAGPCCNCNNGSNWEPITTEAEVVEEEND